MGKQSRRKKGRGGSKGKNHHRPTGLANDPAASDAGLVIAPEDNSPVANVIKKVRHGDPRVRHAALVALSGTLYDSSSLTSAAAKKKKKKRQKSGDVKSNAAAEANNPLLLRALSEKILDGDIPCAITAVGCLSNYVSFYCAEMGTDDDDDATNGGAAGGTSDEIEVTSDVMVPILLQRVQLSLGTITTLGNQMTVTASEASAATATDKKSSTKKKGTAKNKNESSSSSCPIEKHWPSFTEQWSLLSLTLLTLSGLIENCPKAFQRMGANVFPQLMSVFPLASSSINMMKKKEQQQQGFGGESILDAATNASRALHSLLDDNASLITSLPVGSSAEAAAAGGAASTTPTLFSSISELTAVIHNPNFGNMTRLHASGAVLSLRRVLVLEKEDGTHESEMVLALQSCTNEVIVPMLHALFQQSHNDEIEGSIGSSSSSPKQLVQSMIDLSIKVSSQKQDEQLESSIQNDINTRKESAREIARRQKKMKEEKEVLAKQQDDSGDNDVEAVQGMEEDESKEESKVMMEGGGAAMVVEDDDSKVSSEDDNTKDNSSAQQEDNKEDFKQELDNVVQSWRDLMGSYKLALELVANLCCAQKEDDEEEAMGGDDEGMYDDDEHMWDSDDEAKLMAEAQANSNQSTGGSAVSPFEQATYNAMSNQAVQLPEQTLIFFRKWMDFLPVVAEEDNSGNKGAPELVVEDVNELLATCALCLENMTACATLPTWSCSPVPLVLKSISDVNTVDNGLQLFWWGIVSILSTSNGSNSKNSLHNVTSVLLSLLRNQTASRALVDSSTLDLLFNLLISTPKEVSSNSSNGGSSDIVLQMHCHIISMLGVLCSEPHPAEIDARVCSALLERLRSIMTDSNHDNSPTQLRHSIVITHEILNVLMDTYGCDDCHEKVFVKEKALDHFERCLPGFKRRIKKCRDEEEDMHIWNETALNASRFIKYKKEG